MNASEAYQIASAAWRSQADNADISRITDRIDAAIAEAALRAVFYVDITMAIGMRNISDVEMIMTKDHYINLGYDVTLTQIRWDNG